MKFKELKETMQALRKECPWVKERTLEHLKDHLLEESQEVAEAIEKKDMDNLAEELGDLMLVTILTAEVANEKKHFDMDKVLEGAIAKMKRRHPHVFGDLKGKPITVEEVLDNWYRIKEEEKKGMHK